VALRTLRLTELRSTLAVDNTGKIIKSTIPSTGTVDNIVTTAATSTANGGSMTGTTTGIVSSNLTLRGNTGTVTFNIAQTNLSAIGGSNVNTRVENGALVISLNSQINLAQVNVVATGSNHTFTARDTNNNIQFGITSTGIPFMQPKSVLPPLISGLVYISGSAVLPEGYYVGFTGDPGEANADRGTLGP